MNPLATVLGALGGVALVTWLALRAWRRQRILARLHAAEPEPVERGVPEAEPGALRRWLDLADLRAEAAPALFVGATLALAAFGFTTAFLVQGHPAVRAGVQGLIELPGGFGAVFVPFIVGGPWILAGMLTLLPYAYVARTRAERVRSVERDLPLTMELLATMAQAGLAFDAAVLRVLDANPTDRPLFQELARYQRDLLAGVPRVRALRALARRLDIPQVTIFISALVQAEILGTGLAETLRRQAGDNRGRRRAEVLVRAESLSVKLVFPLVICFMPGLFVFTLGPAFYALFQLVDNITRRGG